MRPGGCAARRDALFNWSDERREATAAVSRYLDLVRGGDYLAACFVNLSVGLQTDRPRVCDRQDWRS